ncbi:MAG TPA: response regulator [Myxococcaceae bacterium]|nr:response regulator [Myxococcaceae bacterium]
MASGTDRSRLRILVVDEQSSVRVLLVSVLLREGYQVLPFETAAAALEEMRQRPAHLIIAGRSDPRVDGIDLHMRARVMQPSIQSILITSVPGRESSAAAEREGVREYVIKPFQVDDVLAVCEAATKLLQFAAAQGQA